ncbi:MAG: DUF5916 domain-containing protein [Candidatus Eisenbacteria bacterium]
MNPPAPQSRTRRPTVSPPGLGGASTLAARLAASLARSGGALSVIALLAAPAAAADRFSGSNGHIKLSPPRVEQAPKIDGQLDDEAWTHAAVLDSFTNSRPTEGVRDTLGTIAYVMYDDQNLYVGFRAFDDPRKVQAPVVPRDQIWQGDWVGVSIDTYNDKQRAFFLCSNPVGIQMDGVDQEGTDSDMAPDFQYTTRGHVNSKGYDVEMAIPFRTLRFTPGEQVTFGFQAIRDVKRNGTHAYWAPVTRNINSYFTQMGALEGLSGVKPGRNFLINPEHTTTTAGQRVNDRMSFDEPRGRFGVGLKYGITSNLIADITATPDFSQVEADAGVVDVNSRFAIFFPEKRPFFLEGADIFNTPVNLVYTRRIVDPLYGGKLTGKLGRTSVGVLTAADRSSGDGVETLPNDVNPYLDRDATFTILRMKRDVLKNSYVGLLGGQRVVRDQYNRGAGLDGRFKWGGKYGFDWQGVQSWSRDRNYEGAMSRLDPAQVASLDPEVTAQRGQYHTGNAWHARLSRDTRKLNLRLRALGISPDFDADMGFIQRTDQTDFALDVIPRIQSNGKSWFNEIRPMFFYNRVYNYSGSRYTDETGSFILEADLPHASWVGTENNQRMIRLGDRVFRSIDRHAVWAGSNRFRGVRPFGVYVRGDQVVYEEAVRGRDWRYELGADLRFSSQFDGAVSIHQTAIRREQNDSRFAEQIIPRVRLSYQFNKELALRLITELRSRRRFDVNDQLISESHRLTPDVLLSYYVRPGTVVYLGYGSQLTGPSTDVLRPAQSSVFTKFSYLWEM